MLVFICVGFLEKETKRVLGAWPLRERQGLGRKRKQLSSGA